MNSVCSLFYHKKVARLYFLQTLETKTIVPEILLTQDFCWISISHTGDCEEYGLLGFKSVKSDGSSLTIWRNTLSSSSWLKVASKKQASKQAAYCLLGFISDHKDRGSMFLWKISNFYQTTWHYIPEDIPLHTGLFFCIKLVTNSRCEIDSRMFQLKVDQNRA
jgi:hypothetical protein